MTVRFHKGDLPGLSRYDVEAVAIDTGGHNTHAVYNYCRLRATVQCAGGGREWLVQRLSR